MKWLGQCIQLLEYKEMSEWAVSVIPARGVLISRRCDAVSPATMLR